MMQFICGFKLSSLVCLHATVVFVFPQTVGVLTVGEALISGIYRCVASNLMGRDELDIHFYVTGTLYAKLNLKRC